MQVKTRVPPVLARPLLLSQRLHCGQRQSRSRATPHAISKAPAAMVTGTDTFTSAWSCRDSCAQYAAIQEAAVIASKTSMVKRVLRAWVGWVRRSIAEGCLVVMR
ncbi:MAG TPA: hypothetical protein PK818_10475, partial [Thermomonas sp.]|nr:hypothetical protein [Thermomonas sp.]